MHLQSPLPPNHPEGAPLSPTPPRPPWLFTADQIPVPPPEMRRPPGEEIQTLFDPPDDNDDPA